MSFAILPEPTKSERDAHGVDTGSAKVSIILTKFGSAIPYSKAGSRSRLSGMSRKTMLITGSSKGIGRACAERFETAYEVIRVSRTEGDYVGDLLDPDFRKRIIHEVQPDVFLNNAGIPGSSAKTLELNFVACADLALAFWQKMSQGVIINFSTSKADLAFRGMTEKEILYYTSKSALNAFSKTLQDSRTSRIKVTNLELGFVNTDFANIRSRYEQKKDFFATSDLVPMTADYVAGVVEWILNQPDHVYIRTLNLSNT